MNVVNESSAGGRIGQSLGSGLLKSLENMTQHKLNQVQERHQLQQQANARQQESSALQGLNIPSHIADAISNLGDQNLKRTILSNLGALGENTQGQQQGTNLFSNPADRLKREQEARKASEFQQMEARRTRESQAKIQKTNAELGQIGAKTALTKAQTADIAEQQAISRKNQQLRESIAKVNKQIANEKNAIARQKLEDQKNKMESLITINTNNIEKLEAAKQKQTLAQQKAIDAKLKPYRTNLDKRYNSSETILSKAGQMLDLLNNGEVNSGIEGKFKPLFLSNDATNEFSGLADDVANELAALSTGQQTISKIKFNQQRKPNAAQSTATQIERTRDLIKEANKVVLENDIANYYINENQGENPKDLQQKVQGSLKKVGEPPLKLPQDPEGKVFDDPKKGVSWIVSGPVLRFNGFI